MSSPFRAGTLLIVTATLITLGHGVVLAQESGCADCGTGFANCQGQCGPGRPCPPRFKWWSEGPPKLCFKCACPRPVCDPCKLEHFGYYPTCWSPWPYPPDWSHCPTPAPGDVLPPPPYPPYTPPARRQPQQPRPDPDDNDLPAPNPLRNNNNKSLPSPEPIGQFTHPGSPVPTTSTVAESTMIRERKPPRVRLILPRN